MTDTQLLAVAEALRKRYEALTKTRTPGNLRDQVDQELRASWERNGTDRIRITIGGKSVATLTARIDPPKTVWQLAVTDYDAAIDWLLGDSDGRNIFKSWLCSTGAKSLFDRVQNAMLTDGIAPEGLELRSYDEPARWMGTVLKGCKPDEVAAAIRDELPDVAALLALPDGDADGR